jgi:hypothetical protein
MKPNQRWTFLAIVLLAVAGIIIIRYYGTSASGDKPALSSKLETPPNTPLAPKSATLPRLLQLRGGAD